MYLSMYVMKLFEFLADIKLFNIDTKSNIVG